MSNNRFTAHFGAIPESAVSRTSLRSTKSFAKYFEKANIESHDESTQKVDRPREFSNSRKSLVLPIRTDKALNGKMDETQKSGRNSLPSHNPGMKSMLNNKRSISWGTKIIQEYNPNMQRRSQVRPSFKLNES